ncbi:ornithine carbamoyltransferase [Candidatus Kuenenia stuttgartiensis]|jgi:ornithine carbamoyltransferase|nr:ornithine carbamoyltransferase [Candidatus Kuenenia stuttgartiensis]MBE7547893.1 ornithine carbamoyltransferase [Planctomycetia bacterium]MBZ0192807.1 ornithine carbamoyltransferase [Candidatus Kuenenia stuttgartiensis]QII13662.1 ornithine carbamoyltransferase [Candidatus Kuenenia stuttgartiensis]TVL97836.1 MAG: ornithine carbamoyltransferase [Candidatus Kuenenia stuttgartiensis]GJQ49706.1 MAG: ornithine carbamoyltransferase [Candidatus Kuenenia stuttgartiensis]
MKNKDLISIADLSRPEIEEIFQVTKELKDLHIKGVEEKCLSGRILGLIFEKSSMRTRVSLEVAIVQLGGYAIYQTQTEINLGKREAIKDVAKVLSRYLNGIAIRTFGHDTVLELAKYATIPVINALTDLYHPCQALTDVYTILEKFKTLENIKIVFIGDGNNVAKSLAQTCIKLGIDFHIASPKGYEFDADFISELKHMANGKNLLHLYRNPEEAAENANVIYTDTWTSMGQEAEAEIRRQAFENYQVNAALLKKCADNVKVMHCLPAHRGEEITDEVIDGKCSVVYDQAENRLHVEKAILKLLLVR